MPTLNAGSKTKPIGLMLRYAPLFVSLWMLLFLNRAFIGHLVRVYPLAENVGFVGCVLLIVWLLFATFFSALQIPRIWPAVWGLLMLLGTGFAYYMDSYGVVIDADMWVNIVQTQPQEVLDLISMKMGLYVLVYGLLPASCLIWLSSKRRKSAAGQTNSFRLAFKQYTVQLSLYSGILILVLGVGVIVFGKNFGSFFRENKIIRYYVNPLGPIQGVGKLIQKEWQSKRHSEDKTFTIVDPGAKIVKTGVKPRLLLLIVGETARLENVGINGYNRQTTPKLQNQPVLSYTNTESCGTSTAISVPCMFYPFGEDKFNQNAFEHHENAVDILGKVGVKLLWRDNNSSSKGVAEHGESVLYQNYRDGGVNPSCDEECRDEGMLIGLEDWLKQNAQKDALIVLHQMGSHGPAYYKRYPRGFEQFTPVCKTPQLEQCDRQAVVNAYDNTILYTDYVLSKSLEWLRGQRAEYDVAWLYISDHGESLGEQGIYLHGLPKWIAPSAQITPAMMSWRPEQDQVKPWRAQTSAKKVSHDDLFHTLMGFYGVQIKGYQKQRDWWARP
jgi:lipid A ethanolaminephosphotransferase